MHPGEGDTGTVAHGHMKGGSERPLHTGWGLSLTLAPLYPSSSATCLSLFPGHACLWPSHHTGPFSSLSWLLHGVYSRLFSLSHISLIPASRFLQLPAPAEPSSVLHPRSSSALRWATGSPVSLSSLVPQPPASDTQGSLLSVQLL